MTGPRQPYLSEEEVSRRLQAIEEQHDLLQYEIDGWCAWPMLRFSVSRAMQVLPFDRRSTRSRSRVARLGLALRDLAGALTLPSARYAVKTYSTYHSEVEKGRRKDVFFDDLLRQAGDYFKIEVLNGPTIGSSALPNLVPRHLSTVALDMVSDRLARRYPLKDVEDIAVAISQCVRQELALEDFSAVHIQRVLSGFQRSKQLYRRLFARVKPEVLFLGEVGDHPITAAARELGVQVIECQHGMFHRYYPANSWTKYALPYKPRMPLPNLVFLYGPYWQAELAANGFWGDELRSVGNLRVDEYRCRPAARDDTVCSIVVTLQGLETARLIAFFIEFLRQVEGRLPVRLVFKMHPVYESDGDRFTEAFGGNDSVEMVSANDGRTTFELLKRSHLHVSIYSTCHYEALALGVPTVVLPFVGCENAMPLVAAGHALFPQTPAELADVALSWRDRCVPSAVGEQYFTPHALKNMLAELATLSPSA